MAHQQYRKSKRAIFKSLGRKEFQPKRPWRFWIKRHNRVKSEYLELEKVYSHDHICLQVCEWNYGDGYGAGSVINYDNKEWVVMQVYEPDHPEDFLVAELYCRAYTSAEEKKRVHNTVRLHKLLVLAIIILAPVWIALLILSIPVGTFIDFLTIDN